MEDNPSEKVSLLAYLPKIPKKKRTPREIVVEMESSMVESPLDCQSHDSNQKTKKTNYKRKPLIREERPLAEALAEKIRGMGGERVQLVIQKQLRETDISTTHSRLSIPSTKNKNKIEFLFETEKEILSQQVPDTKTMRGLEVLVIDPRLEELKLCLKRWKMRDNFIYNLTKNWNTLVKENTLEAGDTIQLWAFRVEERGRRGLSDLCFALVKLEQDNNVNYSGTSTITAHDFWN